MWSIAISSMTTIDVFSTLPLDTEALSGQFRLAGSRRDADENRSTNRTQDILVIP
jgi:hypothetical protein